MFINLYESLLKGKPVYTLIFIHICNAMLTVLTVQDSSTKSQKIMLKYSYGEGGWILWFLKH
jgi:hypothetical protein